MWWHHVSERVVQTVATHLEQIVERVLQHLLAVDAHAPHVTPAVLQRDDARRRRVRVVQLPVAMQRKQTGLEQIEWRAMDIGKLS